MKFKTNYCIFFAPFGIAEANLALRSLVAKINPCEATNKKTGLLTNAGSGQVIIGVVQIAVPSIGCIVLYHPFLTSNYD